MRNNEAIEQFKAHAVKDPDDEDCCQTSVGEANPHWIVCAYIYIYMCVYVFVVCCFVICTYIYIYVATAQWLEITTHVPPTGRGSCSFMVLYYSWLIRFPRGGVDFVNVIWLLECICDNVCVLCSLFLHT